MQVTSIIAIYALIWVITAFIMLPFGLKTADEAGVEKVPGQADSAPVNFRPWRIVLRATIIAAVLCALYVVNFEQGWVTVEDIDFFPTPEEFRDNNR